MYKGKIGLVIVSFMLLVLGISACTSSDSTNDAAAPNYSITGTVSDYSQGTPIAGATVSIGTSTASSDSTGVYNFPQLPDGTYVATFVKTGFTSASKIIRVVNGAVSRSDVYLLPMLTVQIDPTVAQTITNGVAQISIAANSLVTSNGSLPSGLVNASLAPIDATNNAGLMPGNFSASIGAVANNGIIETFGALAMLFTDSLGNNLSLADGSTATIRIPRALGVNSSTAPATIPAFYYDWIAGLWVEDPSFVFTLDASLTYYSADVPSLAYWNADQPLQTGCISGIVKDAKGNPVADAYVRATGVEYIGTSETYSASDGSYTLQVKQSAVAYVDARTADAYSQTLTVRGSADTTSCTFAPEDLQLGALAGTGAGSAKITLTWGVAPSDLDSHLSGPDPADPSNRFQVDYTAKTFDDNSTTPSQPYINLDTDNTQGLGPEITTIYKFFPGTYRFSVHHYAGGGATIATSPARVELVLNGQLHIYTPPDPGTITLGVDSVWQVFNIVVADNGSATLNPINVYVNTADQGFTYSLPSTLTAPKSSSLEDMSIFANLPAK